MHKNPDIQLAQNLHSPRVVYTGACSTSSSTLDTLDNGMHCQGLVPRYPYLSPRSALHILLVITKSIKVLRNTTVIICSSRGPAQTVNSLHATLNVSTLSVSRVALQQFLLRSGLMFQSCVQLHCTIQVASYSRLCARRKEQQESSPSNVTSMQSGGDGGGVDWRAQ